MSIVLGITLCVLGAVSLGAQVLLIRSFIIVFVGSELTLGIALCLWMIFTALGAWLGYTIKNRSLPTGVIALQNLSALFIPLCLFLSRSLRAVMGVEPGETLGLLSLLLSASFIMAPLCIFLGMEFTAVVTLLRIPHPRTRTTMALAPGGMAYTFEAAGAVFGGAILTFLLLPSTDPFTIAFLLSILQVLSSLPLVFFTATRPWRHGLMIILLLAGLLFIAFSGWMERLALELQWGGLMPVDERESVYGNIVIIKDENQFSLYENGLLSYSSQDYVFREEAVHLPMLFNRSPRDILAIGLGAGTLEEILKHKIASVDYVELDPLVLKTIRPHLPPSAQKSLSDPRVHIHFVDPRRFLKTTSKHYDVILIDLPPPFTAMLNRCYTLDFFREAGEHLKSGGILSSGLPSSEAYLGRELRVLSASILQSLRKAFPYVRAIPGERVYFVSSRDPVLIEVTPARLARDWTRAQIPSRFITPSYISYRLSPERISRTMEALTIAAPPPFNEDLRPISYFYGILFFLSQFSPKAVRALEALSRVSPWLIALPFLLIPLTGLLLDGQKKPIVSMGIIGFTGMSLEIVLLYAFQAFYGYVYNDVGLLLALFMAGLSLGSFAGLRYLTKKPRTIFVEFSVFCFFSAFLLVILKGSFTPLLIPIFSFILIVSGFLTGLAFPLADRSFRNGRGTHLIYAADLTGGALGAVLTGLLLVPLLGIPQSCLLLGGICASGFICFLQRPGR